MNRQPVATASNYYHHAYAPHAAHGHHYHDPAAFTSVGYRPLQLPLQHNADQQLSLAHQAGFHNPNFRPHQQQHVLPVRTRQQGRQQQAAMAYPQQTDEELAELQKLSNEYEPEVTVSEGSLSLGDDHEALTMIIFRDR